MEPRRQLMVIFKEQEILFFNYLPRKKPGSVKRRPTYKIESFAGTNSSSIFGLFFGEIRFFALFLVNRQNFRRMAHLLNMKRRVDGKLRSNWKAFQDLIRVQIDMGRFPADVDRKISLREKISHTWKRDPVALHAPRKKTVQTEEDPMLFEASTEEIAYTSASEPETRVSAETGESRAEAAKAAEAAKKLAADSQIRSLATAFLIATDEHTSPRKRRKTVNSITRSIQKGNSEETDKGAIRALKYLHWKLKSMPQAG